MRWLTPKQWALAIKALIAAMVAIPALITTGVESKPPMPPPQQSGLVDPGIQVGPPIDGRGSANASALDERRRKDLTDELEDLKDWEEAEEADEDKKEEPPEAEGPTIQ